MAKDKDKRPQRVTLGPSSSAKEKAKALETALASIEKIYGPGSIMKMGDNPTKLQVEVISTGCLAIDACLGVGGVPKGRIIEIYGPESSGKTTVALHIIAEAQKNGGLAAFIDAEHALDPIYAANIGVNVEDLIISQPDTGEQALDITDALIHSGALDVIVIDSVAALVPKTELDGDMGDSIVGLHARLMSQAMRKLSGSISKSRCAVVFINQLRDKIGGSGYMPQETTTGGRALKFYASVRIDVRRIGSIKHGNDIIGNRTRIKISKNKVAPPFKQCEFDIMYGKGISGEGSVIDLALDFGVISRSGAWFSFGTERLGQGRENVKIYLNNNPEVKESITAKIREAIVATPNVMKLGNSGSEGIVDDTNSIIEEYNDNDNDDDFVEETDDEIIVEDEADVTVEEPEEEAEVE